MATIENEREPRTYSADAVRQGEIILKRPWQRIVFIAGLAGIFIFALAMSIAVALMR